MRFSGQATALIERLQHEGGTVLVESPDEPTRALYRRIIHAAKRHRLVPDGLHLRHTGRDRGDIVIRLYYEDSRPDDTDWNRIRLETGIADDEQARLAAQKAAEEAAAERRRQEEEQQRRWQAAMADDRVQAVEKLRKDTRPCRSVGRRLLVE